MKILLIHQSAELYGSDRSFIATLEALIDRKPENSYTVLLPNSGPLIEHIQKLGVQILYEPRGILRRSDLRKPFLFFLNIVSPILFFRKMFSEFDIVYVNTLVCFAAIVSLRFHKGDKYVHVREIPNGRAKKIFSNFLRFSKASLIFNSHATKNALGGKGRVVYNGVASPGKWDFGPLASRPLRLLLIGRINAWKGQDFFLRALSGVERQIEVKVAGDAVPSQRWMLDALYKQAQNLTDKKVDFLNFVADPKLLYEWCDYVVVPSTKPEPFGRVAIEGMAYAKPVVAANHGGLSEIVVENKTGYLFQPGDESSLAFSLNMLPPADSNAYKAMSLEARRRVELLFSVEIYNRNINEIFWKS